MEFLHFVSRVNVDGCRKQLMPRTGNVTTVGLSDSERLESAAVFV